MRFRAKSIAEDLAKAFTGFEGPMAAAATAAVYEAGEFGKRWGRSAIAAGGMSARWQNALRANAYPRRPKTSIDAAVWFYHRIPYAHVFQDGATISGSPLLWARTSAAPQRMGRGRFSKRFTPAAARDAGIKLFSFKSRSGTPLLGAKVRGNRISLAALSRDKAEHLAEQVA